jgi:hypothetical protein
LGDKDFYFGDNIQKIIEIQKFRSEDTKLQKGSSNIFVKAFSKKISFLKIECSLDFLRKIIQLDSKIKIIQNKYSNEFGEK